MTPRFLPTIFASAIVLASIARENPADAAGAGYCPGGADRAVARKVPAALEDSVAETFGIDVEQVREAARVRCVGPQLMACWVGANLSCGKANPRKRLPGAIAFCRGDPNAANIPMAATGHDTIYDWSCVNGQAVAGKAVVAVDPQGYIADNWKAVK